MRVLVAKYNQAVLLIITFLMGAISRLALVASLSLLLSKTSAVYAIYTVTIAETIFILGLRYLQFKGLQHFKFSKIFVLIILVMALGHGILAFSAYHNLIPIIALAILWYGIAILADSIFGYLPTKLTLKYLNPIVAQIQFFKNDQAYAMGALAISILFIPIISYIEPHTFLITISSLFVVIIAITLLTLCQKSNLEIKFHRKHEAENTHLTTEPHFKKMLSVFCIMVTLIGISEYLLGYAANQYISDVLIEFGRISKLILVANLISDMIQILVSNLIARYEERFHGSPINLLFIHCMIMACLAMYSFHLPSISSYTVLIMLLLVTQGAFRFSALQMVISSFPTAMLAHLTSLKNIFMHILASLISAVCIFTLIKAGIISEYLPAASLLIALCVIITVMAILRIYNKKLVDVLYKNITMRSKESAVRAITALSFLSPADYVSQMLLLLQSHPKKLLHKSIMLNLSHRANIIQQIREGFDTYKEEIQLSALSAAGAYKDLDNFEFIIEIVLGKHKTRSLAVRNVASKILAEHYGKYALPILVYGLNEDNERLKANILDVLSLYKNDQSLIPIIYQYIHSPVTRIRSSALIALASFPSERIIYRKGIQEMLDSRDERQIVSALYAVGKLHDSHFHNEVNRLMNKKNLAKSNMKRILAFALVNLKDERGYMLFEELFQIPYTSNYQQEFIHLFSQLSTLNRFNVLEHLLRRYGHDQAFMQNTYFHLKNAHLDFHREIDYITSAVYQDFQGLS